MNTPYGNYTPPRLPDACAPRERLSNLFDREARKRVIFLCAPAGCGKTVASLLWLARAERETVWLSLDRYDNTLSVFFRLLCAGLMSLQADNAAMAAVFQSPTFSATPAEHTVALLCELPPDDRPRALVFDDFHTVANPEIRKTLPFVIKRLPPGFVTLFLSRGAYEAEAAPFADAAPAFIGPEALAFTTGDIQSCFSLRGRTLTAAEAEAVRAATDGWAIGVSALALSDETGWTENSEQALRRYLETRVWDIWDESLRDFMRKTSLVEEMSPALCAALTGRADAGATLMSLFETNAFVRRLSPEVYRYHPLFRAFLREKAREAGLPEAGAHRLAADYFAAAGDSLTALRHAVLSGDGETLRQAVRGFVRYAAPSLEEYVSLADVLAQEVLSETVCEAYPDLYASRAWLCYLSGDARGMGRFIDKLRPHLPDIAAEQPELVGTLVLLVEYLDSRVSLPEQADRFAPVLPHIKPQDRLLLGTLTLELPFLHRGARDCSALTDPALMARWRDTLDALLPGREGRIIAACVSLGLLVEQDRLAEARTQAEELDGLCWEEVCPELAFSVCLHRGALEQADGNAPRAAAWAARGERLTAESKASALRRNFMAYQTNERLADGSQAAARAWLSAYFVTGEERLPLYQVYQHFTTARAHLVLGQADEAETHIARLERLAADFNRPLDTAEAGVLRTALTWARGHRGEALDALEGVLAVTQPYGFVRVITDEGGAILPALTRLAAEVRRGVRGGALRMDYVNGLLLATRLRAEHRKGVALHVAEAAARLSLRQRLMLSLLAQGKTNAEIVALTGLSIHTVKSHTAAAYRKLGVNSAAEAVLKAQKQGLL
ncbi:MAG: LuxR C-terminal-related transcriptional regulator [Oscillospiraceae bacterium]|nr:LuxR C-terminal-related transcriptional regulator [Oscillospiraceae bacterium]